MKRDPSLIRDDSGSVSTLTIILLAAFVGLLAYVIDMGHLHTVHNELRNAADACALRGARGFLPDSIPLTGPSPIPMDPDPLNAKMQAHLSIGDNKSDNVALTDLPTDEIQVGIWNYETSDWVGGSPVFTWPPDSSLWGHKIGPGITLPTKRDGSHNNGPVSMTLAQIFGKSTVAVTNVKATAALSGVGGFVPGTPVFPGGPSEGTLPQLDAEHPNYPIPYHATMRNDTSDTFGWTSLNPNCNTNAADVKKMLKDPTGATTPDCPPGSPVGIQNGVVADAIMTMTANNNKFGLVETFKGSRIYEPDAAHASTSYVLPIFEIADANDPNKFNQRSVVGAVEVQIVRVTTSPENTIDFLILGPGTGSVVPGYGGGNWYGILATEPKLVQ